MFITIITDCTDNNVKARLGTRVASLFGVTPTIIGVGGNLKFENDVDPAEFEAAGCLIDALDAALDSEGIILVNVANRHAKGKKWENGTPFGYFYINNVLVVTTIDGNTLSLIKKLKLTNEIYVTDIPKVTEELLNKNLINSETRNLLINTQFRSYEYEPRLAKWLKDGLEIPNTIMNINEISDMNNSIWFIDNFGNCKTTVLPEDIDFKKHKDILTKFGSLKTYERLKDVPNGQSALIIGSSGFRNNKFIEIVVQGENAAKKYNLKVGDTF